MNNSFTKLEYQRYVDKVSPKSNLIKNLIMAFLVGGLICIVGQFFLNVFKSYGFDKEIAGNMNVIVMVFLGAFFTSINVYDDLGKVAGAGSIVPITGFANSIVSPAMEFSSEGQVIGVGSKMFVIAGPVLVYGISTSVIVGIIYYFLR